MGSSQSGLHSDVVFDDGSAEGLDVQKKKAKLANAAVTPPQAKAPQAEAPKAESPKAESPKAEPPKKKSVLWNYGGRKGPALWHKLSADWRVAVSGMSQSPIDLQADHVTSGKKLPPVQKYVQCECSVINTGMAVKVESSDMGKVEIDGKPWELDSFHFHSPAEHTIDGVRHPLEGHFVHKDEKGALAVVGILYEEGDSNPFLAQFADDIPMEKNRKHTCTLNPPSFGPGKYFRYQGSLTTPPCTENVTWSVLQQPQSACKAQLDQFDEAVPFNNFRPIQDLNGRAVELC